MSDDKISIFKDPVNEDEVKVVVKNALGPSVTLVNYSIKSYSVERLGFLGSHRQLIVTTRRQGSSAENEIHTFFVKSIPYDNEAQTLLIQENKIFYSETNVYKHILPLLTDRAKSKPYTAQCYLVKDDAIVFEDLKARNFSLKDKFLDVPDLRSVLTALGNFHASSILVERQLGKTFKELYPDLFQERMFVKRGQFYKWFSAGTDLLVAVAKSLNLDSTCIPKITNRIFDAILSSETRRNVVCHGDLKSYNILFDDSQPLPQCMLVDFQLVRYAPATVDVLQLLYLSTRRKFRKKHEKELLRHYHEAFCKTLRENDDGIIDIPSIEDVVAEYEEMRVVGMVMASIYGPMIFMDAKECQELTKDSESFDKFALGDRVDAVTRMMKIDVVYRDVVTDIVEEMVQRSGQFLAT